jgi:hypothetical protein
MRINPSQLNAYVREAALPAARPGALVDTGADVGAAPPRPPRPPQAGALQEVLTPEESRFIADLFTDGEGIGKAGDRTGVAYTYAGRPASGSIPGARLDVKV